MHIYDSTTFSSNKVKDAPSIDSMAAIRAIVREVSDKFQSKQWLKDGRVRSRQEANWVLELVNNTESCALESLMSISRGQTLPQQFTYVESNLGLGRGFIFLFICDGCDKKVKQLYMPYGKWHGYRCRDCHQLHY